MLRPLLVRLRATFRRRATDDDLDAELRYHLDRETERHIAAGMAPTAARDAARRAMGNVTIATEQSRDALRWRWIEDSRQDVAYAVRTLARAPGFVVAVASTIGLGLGLLAAAFTL